MPRDCWMQRAGVGCTASPDSEGSAVALLSEPVRGWFETAFPAGPTPAQALAWPSIVAGEHLLLVSPTGTGKTLAAFLAILDRLFRRREARTLVPGLRCVYVSPLRSLNYDIERNLAEPLAGIGRRLEQEGEPTANPVRVGVRTGDTSAYDRRKLRDDPPHILITTPESLSLLLSQECWQPHWRTVEHLIVDEVHAMAATKRGADLAVSLERVAAQARRDPCRVGLSATCRPDETITRFLVGASRTCRVIEAPLPSGTPPVEIQVESLIRSGEAPHRGLSYRRLLRRLRQVVEANRTTVVFANTRAFAEKITHDLRALPLTRGGESIAAHHSALDAQRRRSIEAELKSGSVRAVVTSTSLELGVDIGTADVTVQVGLPGGVSRCLQRVGRSGHRRGAGSRGLLLAASPGELVGAAITARAARAGRVEPIRGVSAPLDVVCQQLVGMACAGEQSVNSAFDVIRKAGPMAGLSRADFDACLASLAGELAAPAGADEAEPGRGAAVDVAADLEARRLVRRSQPARVPMVPQQCRHHLLGGVGAGAGRTGSPLARWRRRMPSGWRRATDLSWTAARWKSAGWRRRSSMRVRPAASRACRDGPAIASRSRPSWPASWPASVPRPHAGSPTRAPWRSEAG